MATAHIPSTIGEFRIESILGQGGSGIVYDAKWGPRRVALKVLHPVHVGTSRERAQFLLEAQRLQQITHPHVVKVFAVGELPDGRPYLAMERLEGETLASVIAQGALPIARALHYFDELCAAVAALHAQGLVHRDLKPENVFIVGGEHAVLLDFGIAKSLDAPASTTTQEGNVRGTPAYMAPERFFGSPAGIATDIYELALVLYAMLAGRLPWDDNADPEARLAPREIAGIGELDVVIRRALSTRAQNRPATADALLAAVRASADVTGPEAGDTARMRPGAPSGEQQGALPHRTPGGPDQHTPLAWAPTAQASPPQSRRRARRVVIASAGVAVLAAGIVSWRLRAHDATPQPSAPAPNVAPVTAPPAAANDPWNAPPVVEPTKALPLVEASLSPETYRAEAAAAIARLPVDTRLVFTLQLGELRAHDATKALLDKIAGDPRFAALTSEIPPCARAVANDAEWIAYGAPALKQSSTGTLVLRGRWKRRDVDACFASGDFKSNTTADGARLYRIGDHGWLDFIDDHTAFLTIHSELDAEAIHKLVKHGGAPPQHVRDMLAKLPVDRALAFVADGAAKDDWGSVGLTIPTGSDLYGWVRIEEHGVALDFAADTHAVPTATSAAADLEALVGQVKTVHVTRDKTTLHLTGTVNDLLIGITSAAVSQ